MNSSLDEFKGALFLLRELNDLSALSWILDFVCHNKEAQMEVQKQNILIY